ncbi:MAG TPA: ABC transporter permease, partial [Bryobacteraceae bacterium]|nr:ABC transporter permease [Bryobacteraceae bacterium]
NSLGTNLVFVAPGTTRTASGVAAQAGAVQTITYEDARAIADQNNVPSALLVSPEAYSSGQLIHEAENTTGSITGVTPAYSDLHDYNVRSGDWISTDQVDGSANVVVLGATVAQTLFPDANPVGMQVRINTGTGRSGSFLVIGVGEAKGGSSFNNPDTTVYIPITTLLNKLSRPTAGTGAQTISLVAVKAVDGQQIQSLTDQINALLLQRHHITDPTQADFTVTSLQDSIARLQQVTGIFTIFLGAVAGISLLVGGIGIMNIMIVSVTERTREIGIRKAVGARRRDIMFQFLAESVLVSLTGGIGGITAGIALAAIGGSLRIGGSPLPVEVTVQAVLLAAGISMIIGIFFGLYPATRAARLQPVEALRYE